MKKYIIFKLIGLAILTMITLVLISFLEVAVYSYLINPGQEQKVFMKDTQILPHRIFQVFSALSFSFWLLDIGRKKNTRMYSNWQFFSRSFMFCWTLS